jgi:hypothetical protein
MRVGLQPYWMLYSAGRCMVETGLPLDLHVAPAVQTPVEIL